MFSGICGNKHYGWFTGCVKFNRAFQTHQICGLQGVAVFSYGMAQCNSSGKNLDAHFLHLGRFIALKWKLEILYSVLSMHVM